MKKFLKQWAGCLAGLGLLAALGLSPASAKTLRIFVLTGQSNSLGTPAATETNMMLPRIAAHSADTNVPFFWDNTADSTPAGDAALGDSGGQWTNICFQPGGYYAYSADHWGPEVGFARMLWDQGYRDFGIVKASRGGGGNSFWCRTNADHYMYSKVVNTVSNAMLVLPPGYTNFQVVCLLYLQGESDSAAEAAIADTRFTLLLANVQNELPNAAGMKAVFGEIASDTSGTQLIVSQKQSALAAARADIGYAPSAGLTLQNVDGLNLHYNADSLIVMGERMAQEALLVGALPESVLPAQTNLFAWYRSDHGVVPSSSATVTRWDDLTAGSTNRDLTQIVGSPQLVGGAFLGATQRNFVRFDGASQAVWSSSATFGFATNARSIFFALRVGGSGDGFLFDGSTSTGMTRAQVRTNAWQAGLQPAPIANATNSDTGTAPRTWNTWQVHEFDYVPTNGATLVRHWINGTNAAIFTNANLTPLGGLVLAANAQAQRFLAVDIAELLVYTSDLSASNRAAVLNYLQANWTPTAIPPDPSGVYAWFAGDSGLALGADNYSVTAWTNLGAAAISLTYTQAGRNLVNLTGAPQKTYLRAPGGAAMGAAAFGGSDGIWAAKSSFGIITNSRTVIAFARIRNATPQGFLFDGTSATPGYTRALVWSNNWQVSASSGAGTVTAPAATNVWQVHSFVVSTNASTSTFKHFINGVLAGSIAVGLPGYLSGLMIGANVAQASGIQADVAEFLVYNSALDDAARTSVENYLSAKWAGVAADPNAPSTPVYLPFIRVFTGGVDGYTCFRIPAIVTTANGTVIAMSDGRIGSCGDIPTPLDLVIKRSFDHGATWGPLQVVTDYGTVVGDVDTYPFYGQTNISRVSAGDAALLLDRANGRIWTLYDNGGVVGGARKIKLELKYSDDDGVTWSPRIDVEALNPGLRTSTTEFLTGPGNGIQLSQGPFAGRLIFPVYAYNNPSASMVIYSDNHGASWQRSANSVTNGGEVQVAELPGGNLIASMRDNGFAWSGVRTFATSTNGGMTWSAPYTNTGSPPTLADPQCQGNIYRLTATNDSNASRLIHANAANAASRINMTLRISYDEGQTWPVSNLVYAAGSAYSSVTRLANGDIGLLFEKDPYGNLDYARRSLAEISGGSDSLPAYDVWAGQHFTPAQLMNPDLSGANADPDGDGFSNSQEYIAGTDPRVAASCLKLNVVPPGAGTNGLQLAFNAVSNKSYSLQSRANLLAAPWQKFLDIPAAASNSVWQLPVTPTNAAQFFRLVTPQLP